MITGIVVQMISSVVLCDHFSATAPRDLRKRNMAMNIAPNTRIPMTTQTPRATLLRKYGSEDHSDAPRVMFNCPGCGLANATPPNIARAKSAHVATARLIPPPPDVMSCTFVEPTCAADR